MQATEPPPSLNTHQQLFHHYNNNNHSNHHYKPFQATAITTTTTPTATTNTNDPSSSSFERQFDAFCSANSSKSIDKCFEQMCRTLQINRTDLFERGIGGGGTTTHMLYPLMRQRTDYWKANELWKKYDKKLSGTKAYKRDVNKFRDLDVLIIGCGPVGLRLSIECAFLGLRVTIVEKRDRFSRNNVLHLWPYTIVDLKTLGAKLFYGKFCAGSIDHISIRKLQCILLKCALLCGVRVHFNTSFESLQAPLHDDDGGGGGGAIPKWQVRLLPEQHSLESRSFDVVIGADGRRNSLPGFKRKEFRGRLAIGITANFVNRNSQEEAEVQERSGVAFIFDQKFFLDLRDETGIDLENIVYYKDDTHYFVMTAKRQSLIEKGVIKKDFPEASLLLAQENVNFDKLCDYAKEAAYVSTNKMLTRLDFAKNHYGQPDVAMFDFTSLFQSENASRIVERQGKKLLMSLVGDSLLEPFWPTGTGIARGFLAAFDTAWMIRGFAHQRDPCELLCERESIYQLLSQTTHDNVSKNYQEYTIDPQTRYLKLNFNLKMFQINQIRHLYDTNPNKPLYSPVSGLGGSGQNETESTSSISSSLNQKSRDIVNSTTLLTWCQMVLQPYSMKLDNFTTSWKDALPFMAIIHRFRPDLIDQNWLNESPSIGNVKKVFDIMRNKLGLGVDASPDEFANNNIPNKFTVLMILDKLYSIFKNHQLIDNDDVVTSGSNSGVTNNNDNYDDEQTTTKISLKRKLAQDVLQTKNTNTNANNNRITFLPNVTNSNNNNNNNNSSSNSSSSRHRKSLNLGEQITSVFKNKIEFFNGHNNINNNNNNNINNNNKVVETTTVAPVKQTSSSNLSGSNGPLTLCYVCNEKVFLMERQTVMDCTMHATCFRCSYCSRLLRNGYYNYSKDPLQPNAKCKSKKFRVL